MIKDKVIEHIVLSQNQFEYHKGIFIFALLLSRLFAFIFSFLQPFHLYRSKIPYLIFIIKSEEFETSKYYFVSQHLSEVVYNFLIHNCLAKHFIIYKLAVDPPFLCTV